MEKIILGLSGSALSEQFGLLKTVLKRLSNLFQLKKGVCKNLSRYKPQNGALDKTYIILLSCAWFWVRELLPTVFLDTAKSSDRVTPNRVHRGDSGLSKTLDEALLRNFPLLVKFFHVSSDSVIRRCWTVTQDNDQDTTAASDSTDSSAWVIGLEQC